MQNYCGRYQSFQHRMFGGSFFMVTRTGIDNIKEHPPSSRRAASAHQALAFDGFDSLFAFRYEREPLTKGEGLSFMVTRTGIEPMLPP